MKILALVLAAVFLFTALCYWCGVGLVLHPKRAALSAALGLLALLWAHFQNEAPKPAG
jgi:hypothetical protein